MAKRKEIGLFNCFKLPSVSSAVIMSSLLSHVLLLKVLVVRFLYILDRDTHYWIVEHVNWGCDKSSACLQFL